jgi:HEAT repeat protein
VAPSRPSTSDPVQALAELIQDPDPSVRRRAAAALGRAAARSDPALAHLRECAAGGDGAAREGAAQAFGYLLRRRTREALEALSGLAGDDDARVRAAAIRALALAPPRAADQALAAVAIFAQHAHSTELAGMHDAFSSTVGALARYRPRKALALVQTAATQPSEIGRWGAARSLGTRGLAGRPGVRRLARSLAADSMPSVRHVLTRSLGRAAKWAPARWQMALARRLLGDGYRLVRAGAAEAIGALAAAFPETALPLVSALASDRDPYIRMGAAYATADAASVDPALALRLLRELASDHDGGVRRAAAAALRSVAQSHPDDAAPLLWRLMADPQAQVRAAAVRASAGLLPSHAAKTAEALVACAADANPQVRRAAADVLYLAARLAPETCAEAAVSLLADEALRDVAAATLAEAMRARPERTVKWLLRGLQVAGDPRVLDVLAACLYDEAAAALVVAGHAVATAAISDLPAAVAHYAAQVEASERFGGGRELAALIRILHRLLQARTLEETAAAAEMILAVQEPEKHLTAESVATFERLRLAARMISRARAARQVEDRLRSLAAAKSLVDEALAGLSPDLDLVRLRPWRAALLVTSTVLGAALEAVRARVTVEARLATRQALRREKVPLLVEVANVGPGLARNVRLEIVPGPGYHPLVQPQALAVLYPGERRRLEAVVGVGPQQSRVIVSGHATYDDDESLWDGVANPNGMAEPQGSRRVVMEGEVILLDPVKPFRPIENPYLPGKPLEPGSPMFFGRTQLLRFLKSALRGASQGNVVVLTGQRRIGKTSLLKQLEAVLGEDCFPIFIDVQGLLADTVALFHYQLAYHTFKSLHRRGVVRELPEAEAFARSPDLLYDQLVEVAEEADDRRFVIMLDEFDDLHYKVTSGLLPPTVFDQLRHAMQHVPNCAFVLAGTHRLEELAGDYWSFLFNLALHRRVTALTDGAAMELVEEPMARAGVACEDLAAAKVCALTGGHPYLTQLVCHVLVEACNEEKRLVIAAEHVDEVGQELIRWGEAHLRYWWDTASPLERAVLAVVAESPEAAEALTAESAARRLADAGVTMETAAFETAIERLVEGDLLVGRGTDHGVFRLRTGLAGPWVKGRFSVDRVAHALRMGEWPTDTRSG